MILVVHGVWAAPHLIKILASRKDSGLVVQKVQVAHMALAGVVFPFQVCFREVFRIVGIQSMSIVVVTSVAVVAILHPLWTLNPRPKILEVR